MRIPEYISPTSLKLYMENKEEYYLRYLANVKAPRDKQTQPMSIGSSFDAYVKSDIHHKLFGKGSSEQFEFDTIFQAQVEPQHRDWARVHGKHVFDMYRSSGALADIMLELNKAIGTPRFEFSLQGMVRGVDKTIGGVEFLGKPDIYFTNSQGAGIGFDWKVNGYLSRSNVSPKPGYVCIKPGWDMHKNCDRVQHKGFTINAATTLDKIDTDWANQLSIYSWLCGEEIGSSFVVAIDQIVCNTKGLTLQWPELRIAQHRLLVAENYQHELFMDAQEMWDRIHSDHYFPELSLEESKSRCEYLDTRAKEMWSAPETEEDKAFQELTTVRRLF